MDEFTPALQKIIERHMQKAASEAAAEIAQYLQQHNFQNLQPPVTTEHSPPQTETAADDKHNEKLQKVRTTLRHMGGDPSLKGFSAVAYGVLLCCENEDYIHNLKQQLYPKVAARYHVALKSIGQQMGNSIQKLYNNMEEKTKHQVFGSYIKTSSWVPNTALFLASLVEYIRENQILK